MTNPGKIFQRHAIIDKLYGSGDSLCTEAAIELEVSLSELKDYMAASTVLLNAMAEIVKLAKQRDKKKLTEREFNLRLAEIQEVCHAAYESYVRVFGNDKTLRK